MKISDFKRSIIAIALTIAVGTQSFLIPPSKSSAQTMDSFVPEKDMKYGYEMLRPAGWTSFDQGDRRTFIPPGTQVKPDRFELVISNYKRVTELTSDQESLIVQYSIFQQNPSLDAWTSAIQAFWEHEGIPFELLDRLSNAVLLVVRPLPGQVQVIAFIVSNGQPLVVGLFGYGKYNSLEELRALGLLEDFETMVASASALQGSPISTRSDPTLSSNKPFSVEANLVHNSSGTLRIDNFVYSLDTWWYPALHKVYELKEMVDPDDGGLSHTYWLYRTNVTDNPQYACQGGFSYIEHTIGKYTGDFSRMTDTYYPNYVNDSIGSQTKHMVVFGDPLVVYCRWYSGFTY
jgi:hypothetical protein